jgi:glycosyltransferase involved in cell wall biosynthesis
MGQLVAELLDAGHEAQLFVAPIDLESDEVRQLATRGAIIDRLPEREHEYVRMRRLRRAADRLFGRSRNLASLVRKFRPDHIFVNQGGTWCATDECFREVLQDFPGRYSLICHSNVPGAAFAGDRLRAADDVAGHATKMFFNSRWTRGVAESQIGRAIPNAGYFQIRPAENCQFVGWPEPAPLARLAMVTRLDCNVKGIDLAVRAVAEVNAQDSRVRLDIFGQGEDKGRLQELVAELGVQSGVRLAGGVSDVSAVWVDHEMLLMPSRQEGLGLAMLEAMTCGRPVLRTPLGGCEEWIEDGANGFVCPAAEVGLLVDTLKRALAERRRWREMGLAAHAKIERDLDPRPGRVFLQVLQPEAER